MRRKLISSCIALFLAFALVVTEVPSFANAATVEKSQNVVSSEASKNNIKKKTAQLYNPEGKSLYKLPLYYFDGVNDLPYGELTSLFQMLAELMESPLMKEAEIGRSEDGNTVIVKRTDDYYVSFDYANSVIYFVDYNAFFKVNKKDSILSPVSGFGISSSKDSKFVRKGKASFERYGSDIKIDLKEYNISLVKKGDKYYIPFQTFTDIFISPLGATLSYNGKDLYLNPVLITPQGELTALGEKYYKQKTGKRSKKLAQYCYNELCFALDFCYGLKEKHKIVSFDQTFMEMGLQKRLKSTNPLVASKALYEVIDGLFADIHSSFVSPSALLGLGVDYKKGVQVGLSVTNYKNNAIEMMVGRALQYSNGIPAYEEVGNTAYVTFDTFTYTGEDLKKDELTPNPMNTVELIAYAHSQITRPNSPIENVVLDLSVNLGGTVNSAAYVLAWMLGSCNLYIIDPITGAQTYNEYKADTNLDGKYTNDDSIVLKNLFCLTSPVSFSCGNLVPSVLKASDRVTILGRTSGGGACCVQPMSLADGTYFNISGRYQLSVMKNGSFYDVDLGVEPDYRLVTVASFYDREKLTDYINGLINEQ